MNELRIAIDGGAATGKSTLSKIIAKKLNIKYINTGQMYRLFALYGYENKILNNENELIKAIKKLNIFYDNDGNINCSNFNFDLKSLDLETTGNNASFISSLPKLREYATELQIKIGKEKGILMEGRDIGSIIMKDADYKFFIKVNPEIAAKRRLNQHISKGENVTYENILNDIIERNNRDENRKIAPLIPSKDSITFDSGKYTAEELSEKIIEVIKNG